MGETTFIGEYTLDKPLRADNGGFSRWGLATKNGRRVFIKEFLTPVYPASTSGLSQKLLESKRALCESFFTTKNKLYKKLSQCQTGNIVYIDEFFRCGSHYYITTEYIDNPIEIADLSKTASDRDKRILTKLLTYNLKVLHREGIVHSDIKPNNLLIKKTKYGYAAKLIDFDASFLVENPPEATEDIHGDFIYLAPEVFIRMRDEDGHIDEKLDVYSLGILLHELWTGSLPQYPREYNYPFEAIINGYNGGNLSLNPHLPSDVSRLIAWMVAPQPEHRPSASQCFDLLDECAKKVTPRPIVEDKRCNSSSAYESGPWKRAGDL